MKRLPIYVFNDLTSTGIYDVPLNSAIQVNDTDGTNTPKTFQLLAKEGIVDTSTIGHFLNGDPMNFIDLNQAEIVPSELEKIEQNGFTGWRILGRNPADYCNIGNEAFDFTKSANYGAGQSPYGASGEYSCAFGFKTQASGSYSYACGSNTEASGTGSFVCGQWNAPNSNNLFEVGCGVGQNDKKNALEIDQAGLVSVPAMTSADITAAGSTTLINKEYHTTALSNKYNASGGLITGVVDIQGDGTLNPAFINQGSSLFKGSVILEKEITIGTSLDQNSGVLFTDISNPTAKPRISWHIFEKDFYVDTDTNLGFKIWHSGNDGIGSGLDADYLGGQPSTSYASLSYTNQNLDLKFDKVGGLISGDVNIGDSAQADLNVTGKIVSRSLDVTYNLIVNQDANIAGNLVVDESLTVDRLNLLEIETSFIAKSDIQVDGTIDSNHIDADSMTIAGATSTSRLTTQDVVIMSGLPQVDPGQPGQLWDNAGVLSISQ